MQLEYNENLYSWGKKVGLLSGWVTSSLLLFFILNFFNKIPANWNAINIAIIVGPIAIIGYLLQRYLR